METISEIVNELSKSLSRSNVKEDGEETSGTSGLIKSLEDTLDDIDEEFTFDSEKKQNKYQVYSQILTFNEFDSCLAGIRFEFKPLFN